ncbi:MAG TPA: glycosyltransferase family 2 protein [Thermoflexia bacterium]|jgi:glycosyltransferase involved in cell wall biosynthesis|nr:glycosyltransferase family 2 protein [Thermoflexia bacterium]
MTQTQVVSIILPTYNRAGRLGCCVQSVLAQTFSDWELIICDDASTDMTGEVARRWVEIDQRIRYLRNAVNRGLPASRNIGISYAKGNLVLFIEDDVILDRHCVGILVETFEDLSRESKVGAVVPSLPNKYEQGSDCHKGILDYAWRGRNDKMLLPCTVSPFTGLVRYNFTPAFSTVREVPCAHSCSLYPREALEEVGGYDDRTYQGNYLYEEADLNIRLRKRGYKLYFQPAAIMHHYIARGGGCRVNAGRYAYYFVVNHIKFVLKNFGLKSVWMVPLFLLQTGFVASNAFGAYIVDQQLARFVHSRF